MSVLVKTIWVGLARWERQRSSISSICSCGCCCYAIAVAVAAAVAFAVASVVVAVGVVETASATTPTLLAGPLEPFVASTPTTEKMKHL